MANTKKHEEKDPEVVIESAIGRTEAWIQQNSKTLITVLAAVVVIIGGYFAYKYLYKDKQQEKAAAAMYHAQDAFAREDFSLALHGDGNTIGFLSIISQYGHTKSGNLARHYAGQCLLREGDYQQAIEYFGKYKPVSGIPAMVINAMNEGLMGDAYAQLGETQKAAAQYEKAVKMSSDALTAPYYSRKAGDAFLSMGHYAKALEHYKRVKEHYPMSMEAREIDKAIGLVEQKL